MMARYEVIETCNAYVKTTYIVDADSPEEAEALVRTGDIEPESEEVYGHQSAEYEVERVGEGEQSP